MKTFLRSLSVAVLCSAAPLLAQTPSAQSAVPAPTTPLKTETSPHFTNTPVSAAPSGSLQTDADKTLYALGVWMGRQVGVFNLSARELRMVKMGLDDSVLGRAPRVDLDVYGQKVNDLAKERTAQSAEKQKKAGETFRAKAAKEKGAQSFPSGLVLKPLKEGDGVSPQASDTVRVHYEGRLVNGKVFDSSIARGQPAEFKLSEVIPCWTEAVQKMKVGGKAQLVCPSAISYGPQGHPPVIPGDATLAFTVELLGIVHAGQ